MNDMINIIEHEQLWNKNDSGYENDENGNDITTVKCLI